MADATGRVKVPADVGKPRSWPAKVFELNPSGLNWPRAVLVLDVLLVPLVVFWAIGHEEYLLSAIFGVVFTALADPGGSFGHRASHAVIFAVIGAALTALGFSIGGDAWGWLVLAAFSVTLVAGLAVMFGVHRFVTAYLLNAWFIIALSLASSFDQHAHIHSQTWTQALAWTGGSVLWILLSFIVWLIRGRHDVHQPFAEVPGDTSRRKLTPPIIIFALIRAIAIAITFALAFGLNLPHGYWMPIAAIVAIKASLDQTMIAAIQRIAGALIGSAVAVLLLLIPASQSGLRLFAVDRGLEVVAFVLLMHAVAIRYWNYALYYATITAAALTLTDLLHPSKYADEGEKVLWTLCGAGIAVLVMLLAGLLSKRAPRAQHQPAAAQPA